MTEESTEQEARVFTRWCCPEGLHVYAVKGDGFCHKHQGLPKNLIEMVPAPTPVEPEQEGARATNEEGNDGI